MKRKWTILSVFACAITMMILSLTACKKDDNPTFDSKLLIGDWYLSNHKGFYTNAKKERVDFDDPYPEDDSWIYTTFSANGKGVKTTYESDPPFVDNVSWSLNADLLKFIYDDGHEYSTTVTVLTSTTLVTYDQGTFADGPYEDYWTFTKMK